MDRPRFSDAVSSRNLFSLRLLLPRSLRLLASPKFIKRLQSLCLGALLCLVPAASHPATTQSAAGRGLTV